MNDDDLYDEFGNYIGEEPSNIADNDGIQSSDGTFLEVDEQQYELESTEQGKPNSSALVKSSLENAYGDDIEVLVETEDTHAPNEPLVQVQTGHTKGPGNAVFTHLKKNLPKTVYDREYLLGMLQIPERIRNVAVIGPLNSGKTSLVDLLVIESHERLPHLTTNMSKGWKQLRYTDNSRLEIERGVSMKLNGITLLANDLNEKSAALNLLDAPGHVNFMDEVAVALTASDCAIICLDVVEGVTSVVENLIKQCQKNSVSPLFVLNKIDRLILDLKLPPLDAYLKIKHVVEQINSFTNDKFSPELNNIIFASSKLGFTFTVEQFVYYLYSPNLSATQLDGLVSQLWSDICYENGRFKESSSSDSSKHPSFVQFILLPIYKLFTHTLSSEREVLKKTLMKHFSINLEPQYLKYDPLPLLKEVLSRVFRNNSGLIQSIVHCYEPLSSSNVKRSKLLNGPLDEHSCTLLGHAVQTIDYGGSEWSLVRIYSGKIVIGMQVRVIDSNNVHSETIDNNNEPAEMIDEYPLASINEIALLGGRYIFPISHASAGQLVLIKGVSNLFTKSATLYMGSSSSIPIFAPLDYINEPVVRVVIEPLEPRELPKLLDGLNKVSKYYPGIVVKVEESGEHVILGFGELYLDSLLYDLRNHYAGIEIKLSNPLTVFSESCSLDSFAAIPAKSSNGAVSISIGAEPMDPKLIKDIMKGNFSSSDFKDHKSLSKRLRNVYGWDSLAARNVWSFHGNNVLIDDTLPDETDKDSLNKFKQQIIQGFTWAIREGPLAEEPIYGVQFKLLEASGLQDLSIGGQLIPLIKKACSIALMTARPVILEPVYEVNVIFKTLLLPILEELFKKRRGGKIYRCEKIVGSPLSEIRAQLPVIESIGFETDLRLATRGGAMCQLHFWNKIWRKVPGDVMDKDAPIPKLKPAPINSLSRDFVMKTRRRKGISNEGFMSNDGPTLEKYVEPEIYKQLKENGLV